MKISRTFLIVLVLLGALVAVKLLYLQNPTTSMPPGPAAKPTSTNVSISVVKSEKFDNKILATGNISANEEVELRPEASGKIISLLFKEGDKVSKGDLLLKLNDADLLAQKKKLEMQFKLATDKEDRQKKLLDLKGISLEDYENSQNVTSGLKADLDFTLAQLAKTEIRAPFNGTIGLKSVSEGSYVSPTIKIASIQQLDPVKIDFSVPEKYYGVIHKGAEIIFTVQGTTGEFKGQIYAIEPKIDLNTRTLQLRALCPNKDGKLLPGSFARVNLILEQIENTILIPTEALIPELKGQKVFVCKNGLAESRPVKTGLRTDTRIEITEGLQPGDSIITAGFMQLRNGAPVKISQGK